jgi:hypothetical protein
MNDISINIIIFFCVFIFHNSDNTNYNFIVFV